MYRQGISLDDFDSRCKSGSIWNFGQNKCVELPNFEIIKPTVVVQNTTTQKPNEFSKIGMAVLVGFILFLGYVVYKKNQ